MTPDRIVIAVGCGAAALAFFGLRGPSFGAAILAGVFAWLNEEAALVLAALVLTGFLVFRVAIRWSAAAAGMARRRVQVVVAIDSPISLRSAGSRKVLRIAGLQKTKRDEEVLRRLSLAGTAEDLRDLFPSLQTLYRRLGILRRARLIHRVGWIDNGRGTGSREYVYCTEKSKSDNLVHDLSLARLLRIWGVPFVCGNAHVDPELLPDATLQGVVHIEFDTGSMPHRRVQIRLRSYEREPRPIVFITRTGTRLTRILQDSAFLAGRLLGCTYGAALHVPGDVAIQHTDGEETTLYGAGSDA